MNRARTIRRVINGLMGLVLAGNLIQSAAASSVVPLPEEKFAVLETKTGTYKNVTVTKKTASYVMILHSTGLCNVAVPDLSSEAQVKLGYISESAKSSAVGGGAKA